MQLQARRRAQASITNSPSSSLTYTQRDVRLAIVTAWRAHAAARAPGGPRAPDGRHTVARGSASRERNHGVGDHPIPFRTRQLSPTSPKVLRRQAAGGQVVPLAGGAFLFARRFLANKRCRMTSLFLFRDGSRQGSWALSLFFQRYLAYLDGMEGRRLAMVFCRPGEGRAPADRSTGAKRICSRHRRV